MRGKRPLAPPDNVLPSASPLRKQVQSVGGLCTFWDRQAAMIWTRIRSGREGGKNGPNGEEEKDGFFFKLLGVARLYSVLPFANGL